MSNLQYKYTFNALHTVSIDLLYSFADAAAELTEIVSSWSARYRGEFQNMGPKIRNMYTPQKDPFWTYIPLKYKFC